jgi:shikimate kinase
MKNVILIGLRGSGKTRVGAALAARLGWAFVDTDDLIERTRQRSIAEIFSSEGEAAFRSLEVETIASVARGCRQVISAGGGAVLSARNRRLLRNAGICVWLTAPPEVLNARMESDPRTASSRPALTGQAGLAEMRWLLEQRRGLYAEVAHHDVDTTGRTVEQVVEAVLALLD